MNEWPPNNKRRFRRLRVGFGVGFLVFLGGCVAVNWIGDQLPASVGPTPCDQTIAGQCARHLTTTTVNNRSATGTVAKPSTTIVSYGPERPCNPGGTDILLVTDGRSVCIIRTTITAQLVWALTTYGVD